MIKQVTIPVMDQTTETVTLAAWLVQEGAAVKQGDVLCEIETEKATVVIESPADGVVRRVLIAQGTEIPPRTVVALIGDATEPVPDINPFYRTARAKSALAANEQGGASPVPQTAAAPSSAPRKLIASPRARKLAEDNGIDLGNIQGTGPEGRIIEDDVKAAIAARAA